jgi:hypothetical protein
MKEIKQFCSMLMKVGPRYPGLLDYEEGDERIMTAQYTCLKTANAVGPDNDVVRPEVCDPSRPCYKEN